MDIDAFILIGGRSSRLGTDKAFIQIEGETLAERTARIISETFPETRIYFVAAFEGQFDRDLLNTLPYPVVFDSKPGNGSWSGLHAALYNSKCEWTFLSACDQPFISPDLLRLMAKQISGDFDVVIARQPDDRLQPLCSFYRVKTVLSIVEKMLTDADRLPPLTSLFKILKTRILASDEYDELENSDRFFVNINTSADLSATKTQRAQ